MTAPDGTDVHDAAAVRLQHGTDHRLAAVEAASEIHGQNPMPGLRIHVLKLLLPGDTGIVDQQRHVTEAQWDRYFNVNVKGAYNAIQAVLPDMLHAHAGAIVTVSSMWGLRGASCEVVYSATKAALIGLTRSLAMELAPSGIRVNCVAPGVIDTDMIQVLGKETLSVLREEMPLRRFGTPEEVAESVLHLAVSEYITGQVLTVDGGFLF